MHGSPWGTAPNSSGTKITLVFTRFAEEPSVRVVLALVRALDQVQPRHHARLHVLRAGVVHDESHLVVLLEVVVGQRHGVALAAAARVGGRRFRIGHFFYLNR